MKINIYDFYLHSFDISNKNWFKKLVNMSCFQSNIYESVRFCLILLILFIELAILSLIYLYF